jgi:hypothetical protein
VPTAIVVADLAIRCDSMFASRRSWRLTVANKKFPLSTGIFLIIMQCLPFISPSFICLIVFRQSVVSSKQQICRSSPRDRAAEHANISKASGSKSPQNTMAYAPMDRPIQSRHHHPYCIVVARSCHCTISIQLRHPLRWWFTLLLHPNKLQSLLIVPFHTR